MVGLATNFLASRVAKAEIKDYDFEGPYLWEGEEYNMHQRIKRDNGFIDEYTN
jgi:hypothetical protein